MINGTFAVNFHFAVYHLLIVIINCLDIIPLWRKWIIYNTHAQYVHTGAHTLSNSHVVAFLLNHCNYTKSV